MSQFLSSSHHKTTGYGPIHLTSKTVFELFQWLMAIYISEEAIWKCSTLTSEKDWLVWKFQVKHTLKATDQWDYVTGAVDPERQGYESKKQKAFYSVLQCIGQRYIPMVMSCQTPKEMWNELCKFFERKTVVISLHIDGALWMRMK